MNDTKWDEVRLAMYGLGDLRPAWRTRCVENGFVTAWDREWFYHFRDGGYAMIEWVEIKIETDAQCDTVLEALKAIHVPGERTEHGFKVYGHVKIGQPVGYL